MKSRFLLTLTFVLSVFYVKAQERMDLIKVAESDYQWTGIAISQEGRMFVNYPSWNVPSPFKVAEIINGKEVAYPSENANNLFVCIQSVVIDDLNRLWILDPASPNFKGVVEGGPKLYMVDLNTDEIVRTYTFSRAAYNNESYLNDVRIDTKHNIAYITDSGQGGIVVLDLESGEAWSGLDYTCDAVLANVKEIYFRSTGARKGVTHSDGIELSRDSEMLYFTALNGNTIYQIPTLVLRNKNLTSDSRCKHIDILSKNNVPTDGMILYRNKLYMANLPDEAIWEYDLVSEEGRTLDFGIVIRWADSFAKDADGYIYFTTSQINYPENQREKYHIYKFKPE